MMSRIQSTKDFDLLLFADIVTLFQAAQYFFQEYTISETVIWSFTTQLICGIRAVHNAKLAVRLLTPQRILVTAIDKCTVRINCAAIADVIKVR